MKLLAIIRLCIKFWVTFFVLFYSSGKQYEQDKACHCTAGYHHKNVPAVRIS